MVKIRVILNIVFTPKFLEFRVPSFACPSNQAFGTDLGADSLFGGCSGRSWGCGTGEACMIVTNVSCACESPVELRLRTDSDHRGCCGLTAESWPPGGSMWLIKYTPPFSALS